MNVQQFRPLAVALGMWVGGEALGQESTAGTVVPASANQKLADAVAEKLTTLAEAQGADVSVHCVGGVVTLTGGCKDTNQKSALVQAVRVVPGVKMVKDGLTATPVAAATADSKVIPVQAQAPASLPAFGPVSAPVAMAAPPAGGGAGPAIEPVPLGPVGPHGADMNAPPLPPNAWPTYAPHNNLSRVGYPTSYPYNAFPFIGPFYPFPKVPPGWRSVKLEWEDGHWWYGRTSTPHDYWRVRFW